MFYFYSSYKKQSTLFNYRFASKLFSSDLSINFLNPYNINKSQSTNKYDIKCDFSNNIIIYKGKGLIGDSIRKISFYKQYNNYKLIISGIGTFLIIRKSKNVDIVLLKSEISINNRLFSESLLGPPLIFCLAIDNIFCFHASAVEYRNQAILFLGKSGSGKSTLADYLIKNSDGKFKRIADDIVPITFIDNSLIALPHFPQLKLTIKQQYPLYKPAKVNISAIYLLKKDNRKKSVDTHDFQPYQRILSLISNTVASRLFDKKLNQQNLEFCNQISSLIPINIISYPHKSYALSKVKNKILEDINNVD